MKQLYLLSSLFKVKLKFIITSLIFLFIYSSYGQGNETFTNLTQATFGTGTYTGDNGVDWNYSTAKLRDNLINGRTCEFKSEISAIVSNGVGGLTFSFRNSPGKTLIQSEVEVFVNGLSQGTFQPDVLNEVKTQDIVNINQPGTVEIKFVSLDYGLVIDDIIWTSTSSSVVAVTGISINPAVATLGVGQTLQLTESISPSNATDTSVTWSSSNLSVATVDASGLVSGITIGSTTITATTIDGGFTATSDLSIIVPVTGISINPAVGALEVGQTLQLTESISPSNATDTSVTWSSSNLSVATVDASGLVSGVSGGDAQITATTIDGGFTATSDLSIIVPVTGISINPAVGALEVGQTLQLTESISPSNATDTSVTWSSSNSSVATVDASGLVSGVSVGDAQITATTIDGGFTATSDLSIGLSTSTGQIETFTNFTQVAFGTGTFTGDNAVDWSYVSAKLRTSHNITGNSCEFKTEISAIVSNGVGGLTFSFRNSPSKTLIQSEVEVFVNGLSQGTFQPDVLNEAKTQDIFNINQPGTVEIKFVSLDYGLVIDDIIWTSTSSSVVAVTGISINPAVATLGVGQTLQLTESISPSNATDTSVTWSSSNLSVATVDASGLVSGITIGSTTITATTIDGGFTATSDLSISSVQTETYQLIVNGGLGSGSFEESQEINITANAAPAGQVFDQWIGDVATISNINQSSATLTMPAANTTVTATYSIPLDYPEIGMGLASVTYFASYYAFVDLIKTFRWIDVDSWDANGYPTSAKAGTVAAGRSNVDGGDSLADGQFVLTWEGNGDIVMNKSLFTLVSEDLTSTPKRRVYDVVMQSEGLGIQINSFPVTNIHLYIPGMENHASLWNPEFINYMGGFKDGVLRFMDMNKTNFSKQTNWTDRTPRNWSTYVNKNNRSTSHSVLGAVSYEAMIELSNEMNSDMWITIPHLATDDYVAKLAHLIKTGVDLQTGEQTTQPLANNLNVWIEYSNEVWNWAFGQSTWVNDNLPGANLDEKYAVKSVSMFNDFKTSFNDNDRIKRVLGTQTVAGFRATQRLNAVNRADYDALAITTYFRYDYETFISDNWNNGALTHQQFYNHISSLMGTGAFNISESGDNGGTADTYAAAEALDVPVVTYEGNEHFNMVRKVNGVALSDAIPASLAWMHDFCRSDYMYDLLEQYQLRHEASGLLTHVPYIMVDSWSKYGQWGYAEYVGQPITEATKYRWLHDHFNLAYPIVSTGARGVAISEKKLNKFEANNSLMKLYPNPVSNGKLTIEANDINANKIQIFSTTGVLVFQDYLTNGENSIDISNVAKGMYIVKLEYDNGVETTKLIVE